LIISGLKRSFFDLWKSVKIAAMAAVVSSNIVKENHSGKARIFEIDPSALSPKYCHIIFPINNELLLHEEWLIITALEYISFHPDSPAQANYHFSLIDCDEIQLGVCSVPAEFRELCRRAGELFGMKMKHESRSYLAPSYELSVMIPKGDHILMFSGLRCENKAELEKREIDIKQMGDWLQKQSLD